MVLVVGYMPKKLCDGCVPPKATRACGNSKQRMKLWCGGLWSAVDAVVYACVATDGTEALPAHYVPNFASGFPISILSAFRQRQVKSSGSASRRSFRGSPRPPPRRPTLESKSEATAEGSELARHHDGKVGTCRLC